ncbi:MAG: hypothetical protein ABF491_14100, partial [Acetobacter sp.]
PPRPAPAAPPSRKTAEVTAPRPGVTRVARAGYFHGSAGMPWKTAPGSGRRAWGRTRVHRVC